MKKEPKKVKRQIKVFGIPIPIWGFYILIALFTLPLIIQLIVLWSVKAYLFMASDILIYYGSLVVFIGTVCLALVALRQNNAAVDTNKKLAETNEELVEITKRYADANDKLVELTEKMQEVQMAEKIAMFEIICPNETTITQRNTNLYSVTFNFQLVTVNGKDFNSVFIIRDIYSSNENWFDEYMKDRIGVESDKSNTTEVWRILVLQSHHKESLLFPIDIPAGLLRNNKLLILNAAVEHEDIYGRQHSNTIKIISEITSYNSLRFITYSIKPREIKTTEQIQ